MQLGYIECYHAFHLVPDHMEDSVAWHQLLKQKYDADGSDQSASISTAKFDTILGDCMAISDIPTVMFGPELIAAYPSAKVILNRRRDVQAWKRSFRETVYTAITSRMMRFSSFFDTKLFWMNRMALKILQELFHGDFEGNAEQAYVEHYQRLENVLQKSGRSYLRWGVEEGWQPLCEYLEKPVPDGQEFPNGNAPKEHDERVKVVLGARFRNAFTNAGIFFGTIIVVVVSMAIAVRSR